MSAFHPLARPLRPLRPPAYHPPVRKLLLAFLLLLAPVASPASPSGEAALLDQVVAAVSPGGRSGHRTLITRSDLELEARILFVSRGAAAAAAGQLPEDTLAAALDWLIAEHLLFSEAESLDVAAVEPAAIERELAALQARFGTTGAWEAFLRAQEITGADLARIVRRRLVVDGYVGSRLRLGMSISQGEVKRAYEARRHEFEGKPWDWVEPRLRAQLEREKRESLVAALVRDLRSRAQVRVLVQLGAEDAPAEPEPQRPWYLPADGVQLPAAGGSAEDGA